MKKTKNIFKFALIMIMCLVMLSLTACGKPVTLNINDCDTITQFEATTAMTVADILEQAQITLNEKDETVPPVDEKIKEETTEILIKRYAKVTVVKGDDKKEVELVGGTVKDAVEKSGITLSDDEVTDLKGDDFLTDGMTINVLKKINVTLTADGKKNKVETTAKTVEELLKEQEITLGDDDEVTKPLDTILKDGMKIAVKRVEYKEETRTETIDYKTQEQYSDSMAQGTSEVTQNGVEGEKEVTYKVKYVDSKEDSKEVLSEKVIKEPTDKIVTYGTKVQQQQSNSNSTSNNQSQSGGKSVVSKQRVEDCDGSGHGYYVITYSDGSVAYEEF